MYKMRVVLRERRNAERVVRGEIDGEGESRLELDLEVEGEGKASVGDGEGVARGKELRKGLFEIRPGCELELGRGLEVQILAVEGKRRPADLAVFDVAKFGHENQTRKNQQRLLLKEVVDQILKRG